MNWKINCDFWIIERQIFRELDDENKNNNNKNNSNLPSPTFHLLPELM